jgi:hypothetical protein
MYCINVYLACYILTHSRNIVSGGIKEWKVPAERDVILSKTSKKERNIVVKADLLNQTSLNPDRVPGKRNFYFGANNSSINHQCKSEVTAGF